MSDERGMIFEDLAKELIDAPDSDIVAMVAIRVPLDDDLPPWAEIYGTGPKQLVAMLLSATAASLGEDTTGQQ